MSKHKKSRLVARPSGFLPFTDTPRGAAPEGAKRTSPVQCTTAEPECQARRAKFPPGEVKAGAEGQP